MYLAFKVTRSMRFAIGLLWVHGPSKRGKLLFLGWRHFSRQYSRSPVGHQGCDRQTQRQSTKGECHGIATTGPRYRPYAAFFGAAFRCTRKGHCAGIRTRKCAQTSTYQATAEMASRIRRLAPLAPSRRQSRTIGSSTQGRPGPAQIDIGLDIPLIE